MKIKKSSSIKKILISALLVGLFIVSLPSVASSNTQVTTDARNLNTIINDSRNPTVINDGGNNRNNNSNVTPRAPGRAPSQTGFRAGRFTNPIRAQNIQALLADFLRVVTMLGAIVVVFYFILSGFKFVTARGNPGKIAEATQALTWTAVGAAVVLGAGVLARVIQNTVSQLG